MQMVVKTENKPIKLWLDDMEKDALNQAKNLANLPFAFKHIAVMPDAHLGYGMPIGGVLATRDVIIPNAVGVDIGCGMMAAKTSAKVDDLDADHIKNIMRGIRRQIPLGKKRHKTPQEFSGLAYAPDIKVVREEIENAKYQIGTLGGGNHFIEIQKDQSDNVWVMLHSGSRNFGYKIANHYNAVARKLNQQWKTGVPDAWQLAFLPLDTKEGQEYRDAMQFAVDFAFANRRRMLKRIEEILFNTGRITLGEPIAIAHNYAAMEHHFNENVMVHRKGATSARKGELGIIPGSQGTSSYIVRGLGNPDSFMSCSHGAGRLMSRTKACKVLDLATEKKRLDDLGVIHAIRNKSDLDEAAGAYKDISTVMKNQADLIEIVEELKPLAVVKG